MSFKISAFARISSKLMNFYIIRCAAQCFNDTCITVVLFLIQCMMNHMAAPGTHFAPAFQYCNGFYTIRCGSFCIFIQQTELIADTLNIIDEFPGNSQASFRYPPYPIRSIGLRRIALLAVTQFSFASLPDHRPHGRYPGRNTVKICLL